MLYSLDHVVGLCHWKEIRVHDFMFVAVDIIIISINTTTRTCVVACEGDFHPPILKRSERRKKGSLTMSCWAGEGGGKGGDKADSPESLACGRCRDSVKVRKDYGRRFWTLSTIVVDMTGKRAFGIYYTTIPPLAVVRRIGSRIEKTSISTGLGCCCNNLGPNLWR